MLRNLLGASATADTMLEAIARDAQETGDKTGRPVFGDAVMDTMHTVPRAAFVPEAEKPFAYENRPLPIGHGQTISQPFVVALMTELLDVEPGARILEVGTGCGYQTAILSELGATVYSVEVVAPLATAAAARLKALGYTQATVRAGDGHAGWPEEAPFDGIIVTAAAPSVPAALVDQLRPGGRLVIPVGPAGATQQLQRLERRADGSCEAKTVLPVAFVPLTRGPA
ncbi:MAG: protein-L-isoaspartate(D-aspartate) O-methyltransferase [Rhodospirillales bacterium]|nr:protein-L-isoaspartate(D-aspartate) O-methyltransferase [Rhodospirillales bacterium]